MEDTDGSRSSSAPLRAITSLSRMLWLMDSSVTPQCSRSILSLARCSLARCSAALARPMVEGKSGGKLCTDDANGTMPLAPPAAPAARGVSALPSTWSRTDCWNAAVCNFARGRSTPKGLCTVHQQSFVFTAGDTLLFEAKSVRAPPLDAAGDAAFPAGFKVEVQRSEERKLTKDATVVSR